MDEAFLALLEKKDFAYITVKEIEELYLVTPEYLTPVPQLYQRT